MGTDYFLLYCWQVLNVAVIICRWYVIKPPRTYLLGWLVDVWFCWFKRMCVCVLYSLIKSLTCVLCIYYLHFLINVPTAWSLFIYFYTSFLGNWYLYPNILGCIICFRFFLLNQSDTNTLLSLNVLWRKTKVILQRLSLDWFVNLINSYRNNVFQNNKMLHKQ